MNSLTIVGEAWGKDEEEMGHPFVGASGNLLIDLLSQSGLIELTEADKANRTEYWRNRNPYFNMLVWKAHPEIFLTNVFNLRPKPSNEVINLCGPKAEGIPGRPALSNGKYVRAEYAPEVERLHREIRERKPNLVIAFGGTASWALCNTSGIRKFRGAPLLGIDNIKVLPTYHPAAVMRDYTLRPIVLADLEKAKRENEYPEIRRPRREVWVEPTIQDIIDFKREFLDNAKRISEDIETKGDQITCIGFSPSIDLALVVPFYDPSKSGGNYWPTLEEELLAWDLVREINQLPAEKIFQNGLYDIHFLWRSYGIPVRNAEHDTMLLHHALQPEMEKGLGFLGTIYTDEAQWKFMRQGHDTVKRED